MLTQGNGREAASGYNGRMSTTDQPNPAEPSPAPEDRLRIRMETTEGELTLELWPEAAPRTVENFRQLVQNGFYDGLTFHRIIPGFIIQGGCPHGDGTGGPGYTIAAEFNDRPHEKGTLSMARTADINSGGSQFFICLDRANCEHLDGHYTVFGHVIEGEQTLDRLASVPHENPEYPQLGKPLTPPQILHCRELYHDEN